MMSLGGIQICQSPQEIDIFKKELSKIGEGDLCEVGVYMGGTARIMAEMHPEREIYLFDTFEGLPIVEEDKGDRITYPLAVGMMKEATLEIAQENLKQFKNVHIYKGVFPETAEPIKDKKFAFVHLDVDTYRGTKEALEFFSDKAKVILVHDYVWYKGVSRAVDEFCEGKYKAEVYPHRQGIIRL